MYTYTTTCHQVSFLAGLNEDLALVRQMCKHLHYGATIKNKKSTNHSIIYYFQVLVNTMPVFPGVDVPANTKKLQKTQQLDLTHRFLDSITILRLAC